MTNYCQIGKLAAVFGVNGQLVLTHSLGKKSTLKGLEALFLELKGGELLPYFILETSIKNEAETYLQLEGVTTREAAQKLVGRPVWLPEDQFQKYAAKTAAISLLGFHIIDGKTDLGEILEVIEQPHQLLCRIDWKGKEALIPLHENFLIKIDKRKKQVVVELPEGLMDVF